MQTKEPPTSYFRGLITTNDMEQDEILRLRGNKIRGYAGAQGSFVFHTKCGV